MSDNEIEENEVSLREEIENAIAETKEPEDLPEDDRSVDDKPVEETPTAPVKNEEPEIPVPTSWSGAVKDKWKDIPSDVRAEINKRENDIHQMFTRHDGDLRLGREMKEIVTPYMATIQAEGGTPATAVRDLLNTAYVLRTGSATQKAQLLYQVAQQYNIDLGQVQAPEYVDPQIHQLQQQLAQVQQMANPEFIRQQLQDQMEHDNVMKEVSAFAADPKNIYYEQVKPQMASLLGNGHSKNLQEAYDAACWANESIRSTLMSSQTAALDAKRKDDVNAKRKAGTSLIGSPGAIVPNTGAPDRSLRDELQANLRAAMSSSL